ncbi:MAG: hypothetical protein KDE48_21280 [Anaerolineales bacterium]|nr:hypothetical protein [Anaerolineales bacterium]
MQRYKAILMFVIAVSVIAVALALGNINNPKEEPLAKINAPSLRRNSSAYWVSQARTVPDLVGESDLIVYARVKQAPVTRIITQELPVLDEEGTPVATVIDSLPFSDTLFEVIKSYSGSVPKELLVMQTGGTTSPSADTVEFVEFSDDPLYRVGEEYILFLVDISGDSLHAPDRQLYRAVSPAGRFQVANGVATTYWVESTDKLLPNTVNELERQISISVSTTIQEDQ